MRTIYKKEWPWRKSKEPLKIPAVANRRRDSAASSVGAASVRRLIARQPPKLPKLLVTRFTLLCIASGLCSTALLPFTAFAGAEAGALPLALMHAVAAVVAPLSPLILQKSGTRVVITAAHVLVCILLTAHIVDTPLSVLLPLYAICGVTLSPMALALTASATTLAQAAGDECRRRTALRRALRGLRASQDLGLVFGSLLLGAALMIWPENLLSLLERSTPPANSSLSKWPSLEDYFLDDDYEVSWCYNNTVLFSWLSFFRAHSFFTFLLQEKTCGSAGCPGVQFLFGSSLNAEGRRILVSVWAALAFSAACLGLYGGASAPAPPPDARSVLKDPRALLGAPMGLFIGLQQGFIYTSYIKV